MHPEQGKGGLGELVRRLDENSSSAAQFPQLPDLALMRAAWERLHADSRLRIALQQAPAEGGPLNSAVLISRMLETLHGLSPGYLRSLIAHADTLAWLERIPGAARTTGTPARRSGRRR